jgi:hypothetical protein
MMRAFLRRLAALLFIGAFCWPATAQAPLNEPVKESRQTVAAFVVAFIVTALVLAVVCMPSRRD